MTIPDTTLIYVGIPAAIYAVIGIVSVLSAPKKPRPADYRLGEQWTHAPLLWTAVDEVTAGGGGAHGHAAVDAGSASPIGGRASGRF